MDGQRVYWTVFVYLVEGKTAVFQSYESQAAAIMAEHGGRFELVLKPDEISSGELLPDEIHVLSFASEDGFVNYRQDPRSQALAPLREESVAQAQFVRGVRLPNYGE